MTSIKTWFLHLLNGCSGSVADLITSVYNNLFIRCPAPVMIFSWPSDAFSAAATDVQLSNQGHI
jgi:hypothetical protein